MAMRSAALALAVLIPILGSGCAAFSSRHISFTATCSYLQISKTPDDNRVYENHPMAYTFAPIGAVGLLALDILLLPITFIHDTIQSMRGVSDEPFKYGTYASRYRRTIHSVISVR
ncbi:MAG: hypothetical protein O7H41_01265 [Planctomycetota bacterium]|nr:hypothetical protein [Planctomycetota bacterium]